VSDQLAIAEVRRLHTELGRSVERARSTFSGLSLATERTPERDELTVVLEITGALASALASLLDGIDRVVGNEGVTRERETVSAEVVRALLTELEPAAEEQRGFHPGIPRRDTPIGVLPSFYGYLLDIDNALFERGLPKSFVWRETMELWVSFVYLGGTHASGGVLSRLDRIQQFPGVRKGARSEAYYPWDRKDVVGLQRIAERARFLAIASAEDIAKEHRRVWCEGIDGWLKVDPRRASALLERWVDEAPKAHPDVVERLRAIADNEAMRDGVRRKALAKIRSAGA